jgi:hypothetical protein
MLSVDPNECCCDSSAQGAALGLLGLMTGLSEEYFRAGWVQGLEYSLWSAEPGQPFGSGEITERQTQLLRLLSAECEGWWIWQHNRPKFVTLEWWRAHAVGSSPQPA